MKVILFGATGMVGQGALRECLLDPDVESVLTVGRSATGQQHEKLTELVHQDFTDFSGITEQLTGYDACFFCLGASSAGMKDDAYRRITYDFTLAAARTLAEVNPDSTFIYISGEGTDSTEKGRTMWARVKGKTENDVLALPFHGYAFRPGYIHPMHGAVSKTTLYRVLYKVAGVLYPLLKRVVPKHVTNTEQLGRAMLAVAKNGAPTRVLENPEINSL